MVFLRKRLAVFIRQQRGSMPQRDFARRIGVAQSTIMRIESEDQNVTLDTLEQFCTVFRVEVGELFPPPAGPRADYRHTDRPVPTLHEPKVTASAQKTGGQKTVAGKRESSRKKVR